MFIGYNDYRKLTTSVDSKDYKSFYKEISNKIEFGGAFTNYDYLVKYRFMNIFQPVFNAILRRHPSNILDIGCGNGVHLPISRMFPLIEYHGLDYAEKAIENARKEFPHVVFHVEDAFNTSFDDKSFDMIILSSVLILYKEEDERLKLLREVERILKNDGVFILIVWKENVFLKKAIQLSRLLGRLLKYEPLNDFMAVYFSERDIKRMANKISFKIREAIHPSALYGVLESVRYLNLSKYNRVYGKSESEALVVHSQNILEDLKQQAGRLKWLTVSCYYLSRAAPCLFSHHSIYIMEKQK